MKHYWVVSPEMKSWGSDYEPPEIFRCVALVEAKNKREARHKAIKDKYMREWVEECRSDKVCPFAHLEVTDCTCPHGICECDMCEQVCEICEEKREIEFKKEMEFNEQLIKFL